MTDITFEEARAKAKAALVEGDLAAEMGVPVSWKEVRALHDALRALLAVTPEPPTTDDREAFARFLKPWAFGEDWLVRTSQVKEQLLAFAQADHIFAWLTAAGFRRTSPPTEEQWEYGAIYQGDNGTELRWFSMGSGAFTIREAAEREVERFVDAQIVLGRRTRPGPWEPVEDPS